MVLNGPNLNLLGKREPEIYGRESLTDIMTALQRHGAGLGIDVDWRQSNHEGELVDWLQEAGDKGYEAIILNPGAYGHTSIAIHDAMRSIAVPVIEVHLSNPQAREEFRRHSYVSLAAAGVIQGFGATGYKLALDAAAAMRQGDV